MVQCALTGRPAYRFFLLLLCLAVLGGCKGEVPTSTDGGGGSGEGQRRLIMITNAVSPFWDAADIGARNAAKDLNLEADGLRVVFEKNDSGTAGQIARLKQLSGATDIAGLAISVTDPGNPALIAEMKKLRESGVKVITIDSDVDRSRDRDARFAYIGTDNISAGAELGRCAKALVPEGGKYATFVGFKSQANAIERNQGFAQGAGEKFEQVENLGDEVDESRAQKNVRDAYDRNPDIRVYVGIWSYNTPAIMKVTGDLGIRDKVSIVGFDADPPSIVGMAEGKVDALVVQNPYQMGYQGVRLLQAMLRDDQTAIREMYPELDSNSETGDIYDTGLKVIAPDEGSPLKADLFNENTQFLTLSEFRKWLEEYGLTGS